MDLGNICPKGKNISIVTIFIISIIASRISIIDEIVVANATVRKSLGYFGSTFLLFVTYFFYKHLREVTEAWKPLGIMGVWKSLIITTIWKLSEITGISKPPGVTRVSKNRWKVIIYQGFVKTVGNPLATLDLLGEKQTAGNILNES